MNEKINANFFVLPEPILDRLKDNPTMCTMSALKAVDKETFQIFYDNSCGNIAAFDFRMNFNWLPLDEYQKNISIYEPHKSPTLAGAGWACWKSFLKRIDYLDIDFDIWGGDDIDLSFKIWVRMNSGGGTFAV